MFGRQAESAGGRKKTLACRHSSRQMFGLFERKHPHQVRLWCFGLSATPSARSVGRSWGRGASSEWKRSDRCASRVPIPIISYFSRVVMPR